jgi:hypothetical protein
LDNKPLRPPKTPRPSSREVTRDETWDRGRRTVGQLDTWRRLHWRPCKSHCGKRTCSERRSNPHVDRNRKKFRPSPGCSRYILWTSSLARTSQSDRVGRACALDQVCTCLLDTQHNSGAGRPTPDRKSIFDSCQNSNPTPDLRWCHLARAVPTTEMTLTLQREDGRIGMIHCKRVTG